MMRPRVSVLLGVFNGGAFLSQAVESILAQTMPDFELLVIDDGSTDGSGDLVKAYHDSRIRVIRNKSNLGLTRSLNIALELARGDLIARQDAEDISHPERFTRQITFLDANPAVVLLGAQSKHVDINGWATPFRGWPKATGALGIRWQLMFDNPFVHTSVMFRRSVVWQQLAGYNETFRTNQDFELWSRVAADYEVRNLPNVLVTLRSSALSVSRMYRAEDVARVQGVLLENRRRWLQSEDLVQAGLEAWMAVNNPANFDPPADLGCLAVADIRIFRRFSERYPEAVTDPEIRTHRAVSLARVACAGARQGARRSSVAFSHACRIQPSVIPLWGPRYIGSALLRWHSGEPALPRANRVP